MINFNETYSKKIRSILKSVFADDTKKAAEKLNVFEQFAHYVRVTEELFDFQSDYTFMVQSLFCDDLEDCIQNNDVLYEEPLRFNHYVINRDLQYFLFGVGS
jgi:hypothetical protein